MKKNFEYSHEHLLYLRGVQKKNILVNVARFAILLFFLLIWELSAQFKWINPFITSSPSRIAKTIAELYTSGSLFHHLGTTLWETLAGFAIAVALGYSIALLPHLRALFRRFERVAENRPRPSYHYLVWHGK